MNEQVDSPPSLLASRAQAPGAWIGAPGLLLVEDDARARRAIARLVTEVRVLACGSVASAREAIQHAERLVGAIVDLGLPDGSGLEVVEALRERWPRAPVLVLTGRCEPEVIAQVQQVGAEFLCKPPPCTNLQAYVTRALEADPTCQIAAAHRLSRRETQVLWLLVSGVPRKQLPDLLGVTAHTIRTYAERIVEKTASESLSALVERIWIASATSGSTGSEPPPSRAVKS
ncbi:MAG: response regulator [Polyangiaceae bacterium]